MEFKIEMPGYTISYNQDTDCSPPLIYIIDHESWVRGQLSLDIQDAKMLLSYLTTVIEELSGGSCGV